MRRHETNEAAGQGSGRDAPRAGFTMVELLIVMVIVGILIAFILNAAMDGIRRAEERSTESLIAKLDAGMTDRLDAILAQSVEPNNAHAYLAAMWNTAMWASAVPPNNDKFSNLQAVPSNTRAYAIAKIEYVKSELPDVFVVQAPGNDPLTSYPFNFAASPYTASNLLPATPHTNHAPYMLPMGTGYYVYDAVAPSNSLGSTPLGGAPVTTGIYGASYTAAAGLYKQLFEAVLRDNASLTPPTPANAGFDGVDNNRNGLIDEIGENGKDVADAMYARLRNHTHKTARAEMLYALLVEGQGPLGSAFLPDEFRDNEVRDTDGDGLLEFVDAWGEPIQYFRWPIFYVSNSQRGYRGYLRAANGASFENRDQNPLDPNQQLVAPAWWGAVFNANAPFDVGNPGTTFNGQASSDAADFFQRTFFTLTDPNAHPTLAVPPQPQIWDRGPIDNTNPTYARRAFYSRFLILSGGADRVPGVPIFDAQSMTALAELSSSGVGTGPSFGTLLTYDTTVLRGLQIEGQAAPLSPIRSNDTYMAVISADDFQAPLSEASGDDISSQNLQAPGGATQ